MTDARKKICLTREFDAVIWAREFMKVYQSVLETGGMDEDWMRTWFANAIMAGYDIGYDKALADLDKLDLSVEELKKVILSQGSYGQWNSDELRTVYVEKLAQALIDARERKRGGK